MDGVYTQEFMFEEFKNITSKKKKVEWLVDMKDAKIKHPNMFRGNKISVKNFDKLIEVWSQKSPKKYVFTSFKSINNETIDKIVPIEFKGREIVDLIKDETDDFKTLFSKLTDTKAYKFSDVAKNTPLIESKRIMPFTLKK